jgi:hypothetical protein
MRIDSIHFVVNSCHGSYSWHLQLRLLFRPIIGFGASTSCLFAEISRPDSHTAGPQLEKRVTEISAEMSDLKPTILTEVESLVTWWTTSPSSYSTMPGSSWPARFHATCSPRITLFSLKATKSKNDCSWRTICIALRDLKLPVPPHSPWHVLCLNGRKRFCFSLCSWPPAGMFSAQDSVTNVIDIV